MTVVVAAVVVVVVAMVARATGQRVFEAVAHMVGTATAVAAVTVTAV